MMLMVFWALAPFGFVDRCQRFGETYCLLLQGWSDKAGRWLIKSYSKDGLRSMPIRNKEYGDNFGPVGSLRAGCREGFR
jgi:hypothetical protein